MIATTSAAGAVQLSSSQGASTSPTNAVLTGRDQIEPAQPDSTCKPHAEGKGINRRSLMNMLVGAAAIGGAVPSEQAVALPVPKPLDRKNARPELGAAIDALGDAYDALKSAYAVQKATWELWEQWENRNPEPASPRAWRKWERRADKYNEEIGFDSAAQAAGKARAAYHNAQFKLGHIRAHNLEELTLKSGVSVAFEAGILEEEKKGRAHLGGEQAVVAFSVAMDAILLFATPPAAAL